MRVQETDDLWITNYIVRFISATELYIDNRMKQVARKYWVFKRFIELEEAKEHAGKRNKV